MHLELPFPPPPGSSDEAREAWRILALWQLRHQQESTAGRTGPATSLDIGLARPRQGQAALTDLAPPLEAVLVAGGLISQRQAVQAVRLRWLDAPAEADSLAVLATRDARPHLAEWMP